ncbi:hypothetical protein AAVH_41085, partial [Aphelenchoides avenae]
MPELNKPQPLSRDEGAIFDPDVEPLQGSSAASANGATSERTPEKRSAPGGEKLKAVKAYLCKPDAKGREVHASAKTIELPSRLTLKELASILISEFRDLIEERFRFITIEKYRKELGDFKRMEGTEKTRAVANSDFQMTVHESMRAEQRTHFVYPIFTDEEIQLDDDDDELMEEQPSGGEMELVDELEDLHAGPKRKRWSAAGAVPVLPVGYAQPTPVLRPVSVPQHMLLVQQNLVGVEPWLDSSAGQHSSESRATSSSASTRSRSRSPPRHRDNRTPRPPPSATERPEWQIKRLYSGRLNAVSTVLKSMEPIGEHSVMALSAVCRYFTDKGDVARF